MGTKRFIRNVAVISLGALAMGEASKMPKPYADITGAAIGLGVLGELSKGGKNGRINTKRKTKH